jgi:hypothetical protein
MWFAGGRPWRYGNTRRSGNAAGVAWKQPGFHSKTGRGKGSLVLYAMIEAGTRVIGTYGLSAPTAMIAKQAGVSNGLLFAYFETKADLLNQLLCGAQGGDGYGCS